MSIVHNKLVLALQSPVHTGGLFTASVGLSDTAPLIYLVCVLLQTSELDPENKILTLVNLPYDHFLLLVHISSYRHERWIYFSLFMLLLSCYARLLPRACLGELLYF